MDVKGRKCRQCGIHIQPVDFHFLYRDCLSEDNFVSKERITCGHCANWAESTYRNRRHCWLARQATSFEEDGHISEIESPPSMPVSVPVSGTVSVPVSGTFVVFLPAY